MKIFSLLITVLVSASMVFSQTSLQGTVTDAETGEPIIFGTVALYRNDALIKKTDTDLDGFYSMVEIDPGTYDVEFNYTGYGAKKITTVTISAGKANLLDSKMKQGVDLPIEIEKYVTPLIPQPNHDQSMFSKEQIKNIPDRSIEPLLYCWGTPPKKSTKKENVLSKEQLKELSHRQLVRSHPSGTIKYKESSISIQGTVTDAETGRPIIFGTVALFKNNELITGTDTDLDGFYSITEIDPGTYDVEFIYTGYASQKITGVTISAGKANLLDVKMTQGVDLMEVVVVYEAPLIEQDNTTCGAVYSKEQIKNLPTRSINSLTALSGASTNKKEKNKRHKAKRIDDKKSIRGTRSDVSEYYMDGIRASKPISPKKDKKPLTGTPSPSPGYMKDAVTDFSKIMESEPSSLAAAGTLTAGEIHDFSSWDLWQDIADIDLEKWRAHWQMHPTERYTIQAMTEAGQAIVDAEVKLVSQNKKTIWTARTDNTGKAELWANAFSENMETGNLYAEISHAGQTKKIEKINVFKNGINTVVFNTPCEQPNNIDLLFVVDATGSMNDEIDFLKAELTDVIEKAQAGLPDLNLNLGSLFYRDIRDEYLTRQSPFSNDISQTVNFIKKQKAGGGGDKPEAVEIALAEAIHDMPWSESARARLLFLVLDAPPHHTPDIVEELKTLSMEAAAKGIRIIPVAGSGIDKSTEYLSRSLALLTNGTYTFLTDDSGIGGSHIEPTSDIYEVEKLNGLLVRLILQFSEMPDCEEAIVDRNPEINNDIKLEKKMGLKIFPNPSSGPMTIKLKMDVDNLYVTDLTGKILLRYNDLKKGKTPISLSNLPNGSYLIRVEANGKVVTERVVVLH